MRAGRIGVAGLAAGIAALTLCAPAGAEIYWANEGTGTIGRASLAGTPLPPITGAIAPRGVALDGSHVYWAHDGGGMATGNIGRANLDGTTPDQTFLTTSDPPQGLAIDPSRIFWTQTVSGVGKVARVNLAGGAVSQTSTSNASPCGVASDADKFYWANGGSPDSIGSSHGFGPNQNFITATDNPCGVAVATGYVYWTNRAGDSIGRANIDGTSPVADFIDTGTGSSPCGVAIDGPHIYWSDQAGDKIGRVDLDGTSNLNASFIDAGVGSSPCGVAVTPVQEAVPATHAFAETAVGGQSDIQSFFAADRGSSVLDVTDVSLIGANPADFEKTGDGCTINVAPAAGGCIVNVRFSPTAEGPRSATLRITSNASNSPTDILLTGTATTPAPAPDPIPAGDTEPPDTTIVAGPPGKTKKRNASFGFSSTEPGSAFECRLDDGPFEPCVSPKDYRVGKGKHSFEARATDPAGNADPTPATRSWTVKKRKPRK